MYSFLRFKGIFQLCWPWKSLSNAILQWRKH